MLFERDNKNNHLMDALEIRKFLDDHRQATRSRFQFYQKYQMIKSHIDHLLLDVLVDKDEIDLILTLLITIDDSAQEGIPLNLLKTEILMDFANNIFARQQDVLLKASTASHLGACFPTDKVISLLFKLTDNSNEDSEVRDEAYLSIIKQFDTLNKIPISMSFTNILKKFIETSQIFQQSNISVLVNRASDPQIKNKIKFPKSDFF